MVASNVSGESEIKEASFVAAGSIIAPDVFIGEGCIINHFFKCKDLIKPFINKILRGVKLT